jgi:hypothetical protein
MRLACRRRIRTVIRTIGLYLPAVGWARHELEISTLIGATDALRRCYFEFCTADDAIALPVSNQAARAIASGGRPQAQKPEHPFAVLRRLPSDLLNQEPVALWLFVGFIFATCHRDGGGYVGGCIGVFCARCDAGVGPGGGESPQRATSPPPPHRDLGAPVGAGTFSKNCDVGAHLGANFFNQKMRLSKLGRYNR